MTEKLDLKDRKILYVLSQNARVKAKELAKLAGLSKNSVLYRIKSLKEKGIIQKFHPILNYKKLGLYTHDILIKLRAAPKDEEKIKDFFKKHPNILWGVCLFGEWDLFIQIIAKDLNDFQNVLREIIVFIGEKIDRYEVKVMVNRLKITRYLPDLEKVNYTFKRPEINEETTKIDETDKKILDYLNTEDGAASYAKVGDAVNISMETARNRMNSMFKEGVILNYLPLLSYPSLDLLRYFVIVSLRNTDSEKEKEIINYLKNKEEINLLFQPSGTLELYFFVTVKKPNELEKLIKDLKLKFFENVLSVEHMLKTEELTLTFFPKALMNI